MINIKKQILILGIITVALAGTVYLRMPVVHAQSPDVRRPFDSIIQKLVQRFGLKEEDVRKVFTENRQERRGYQLDRFNTMLDEAVKSGRLTQDQKKAIIAKHQEILSRKTGYQNMTPEQRKQAMLSQRQELEAWAKDHGIDIKYLFNGRMGMGKFRGMGWNK